MFKTARVVGAMAGIMLLSLAAFGGTAQADSSSGVEITCRTDGGGGSSDSLGWDLVPMCVISGRLG
ncbi:hypothetical protein [Streptomyces sp. NPDC006335]|uniref:hypothetical protein n=1 Tax=Streptomyces sp. NPDC006335 TaxID=3156895 RepID=UPI0033BDDA0F